MNTVDTGSFSVAVQVGESDPPELAPIGWMLEGDMLILYFDLADMDLNILEGETAAPLTLTGYTLSGQPITSAPYDIDATNIDFSKCPGTEEDPDDGECQEDDGSCSDDDVDGFTENKGDCNDDDASVNPDAEDICDDGIDQNCDGADEECNSDGEDGKG
jgi:hypothetical protein